MNPEFLKLLLCPQTSSPLELSQGKLKVQENHALEYRFIQGIPWLFKDPQNQWLQWRSKSIEGLGRTQKQFLSFEKALNSTITPLGLAKERLERKMEAYRHNKIVFQNLLVDFLSDLTWDTPLIVLDQLPSRQNIDSYFDNIFRDWAWNSNENEFSLKTLRPYLPHNLEGKNFLVLGSGSGRLGVDLHRLLRPSFSVFVDFNPALMLIGHKVWKGEQLELFEFPVNPIHIENSAVKNILKSPFGKTPNIYPLFADVQNLPLMSNSIDCLITPWLIDIISDDFLNFARRLNRILKVGGQWINFGPLAFSNEDVCKNYSYQEVLQILLECGFSIAKESIQTIPYLCSPNSGHGRNENVLCFTAEKISEVKAPNDFSLWPEWLNNPTQPIPLNSTIQEMQLTHKVHAEVLGLIDGKRNQNDIADIMSRHYGMAYGQSADALKSLLLRIFKY